MTKHRSEILLQSLYDFRTMALIQINATIHLASGTIIYIKILHIRVNRPTHNMIRKNNIRRENRKLMR